MAHLIVLLHPKADCLVLRVLGLETRYDGEHPFVCMSIIMWEKLAL